MSAALSGWQTSERVLGATVALVLIASGAVALSSHKDLDASREFQSTVRGLGLGRSVTMARCVNAFDARLDTVCELRHDPFPGAGAICPDHLLPPADAR